MYTIFYDTLVQTSMTFFIGMTISFGFAMIVFHLVFWISRPAIWIEIWSPEGQSNPNHTVFEKNPDYCSLVTIPMELTTFRLPVATMNAKVKLFNGKKHQMFTREYLSDADKSKDHLNEGGKFYFEYSGKISNVSKIILDVTCRFRSSQVTDGQVGMIFSMFQHRVIVNLDRLPGEIKDYFKKGIVIRENNYRKAWLVRPPLFIWQSYEIRDITKRAHLNGWDVVSWERKHTWEGWK